LRIQEEELRLLFAATPQLSIETEHQKNLRHISDRIKDRFLKDRRYMATAGNKTRVSAAGFLRMACFNA
jgi:hypothetical protein